MYAKISSNHSLYKTTYQNEKNKFNDAVYLLIHFYNLFLNQNHNSGLIGKKNGGHAILGSNSIISMYMIEERYTLDK